MAQLGSNEINRLYKKKSFEWYFSVPDMCGDELFNTNKCDPLTIICAVYIYIYIILPNHYQKNNILFFSVSLFLNYFVEGNKSCVVFKSYVN